MKTNKEIWIERGIPAQREIIKRCEPEKSFGFFCARARRKGTQERKLLIDFLADSGIRSKIRRYSVMVCDTWNIFPKRSIVDDLVLKRAQSIR